jgi:hypothetical protein
MAILVLSLIAVVVAVIFISDDESTRAGPDTTPVANSDSQAQSTFPPVTGKSQHSEPGVMEFPEEADRDAGTVRI